MGNRVTGADLAACAPNAVTCCMGSEQGGTLVVKTPVTRSKVGFAQCSEEACGSLRGPDEGDEADPETTHPVAVNTFDKLTHIHSQIHKQLSRQELLIQQLLRDGEGFDAAFEGPVVSPRGEQQQSSASAG
eukprot:TRINITY_DN20661_c0_g1_i1.p1 TRINITY_DN20661_c0_g1~~TRINITY_DN20661_c0_g1_i1.p1  ORF type:complete len:131 (+),score=23.25 TRINITY_DN20661_c0_g1_i1:34-426(+)